MKVAALKEHLRDSIVGKWRLTVGALSASKDAPLNKGENLARYEYCLFPYVGIKLAISSNFAAQLPPE